MLGLLTGFSLSLAQSFGGSLLGLLTGFSLSLAPSFPSTSFVRLLDGGFSLLLSIFAWCSLSGVRHANDLHGWRGSAAECPTPAFSGAAGRCVNWHGWRHGTTFKNRAQPRGRASGVRCKAMFGGFVRHLLTKSNPSRRIYDKKTDNKEIICNVLFIYLFKDECPTVLCSGRRWRGP